MRQRKLATTLTMYCNSWLRAWESLSYCFWYSLKRRGGCLQHGPFELPGQKPKLARLNGYLEVMTSRHVTRTFNIHSSSDEYDKSILALSSGALGIFLAFMKDRGFVELA